MNANPLKTRFAPSPTGLIHLGNLRTALFSALFAHGHGGVFLLRIEDTDRERSSETYTQALQHDLKWLGLDWQEGPGIGGENGPYHQSERQTIYDRYYQQLQNEKRAYPCFCSEEQLQKARKIQRVSGKPPRYPGTCRSLSPAEIQARLNRGERPSLRFRVPADEEVVLEDLICGTQRFSSNDIGDFIIRRTDGTSSFMFCNAIDDALMGVTHVLRGVDHITNTPRQLLILKALDLPTPHYGHLSLILGQDGGPLSKRTGSRSVRELREQGFLPIGVLNYLGRLGHTYSENKLLGLQDLAKQFTLENIHRAPARYDEQQLLYWQKEAMQQITSENLWELFPQEVKTKVPERDQLFFTDIIRPNIHFPNEAVLWMNAIYGEALTFNEEDKQILKQAGSQFFEQALAAFKEKGIDFAAITQILKEKLNVKGKQLFMPLRLALTGQTHGPEMAQLLQLMPAHQIERRLNEALEQTQGSAPTEG